MKIGKVLSAFWYALFSIAGALLAHLWQIRDWAAIVAVVVGFAAVGYVAGDLLPGAWLFPRRPVQAAWCLELWIFLPGVLAACAAAAVIIISSSFTQAAPDEKADALGKAVFGKSSDALTALLAALFLKVFEDADDDVTGDRVAGAFAAHYRAAPATAGAHTYVYAPGAAVLNWVHGDANPGGIPGWGFRARRRRAAEVAAHLTVDLRPE